MKRLSHFVPNVLAQIPQIPRQLGAHDRHVVRIRKDVGPDRVRDVERLPPNHKYQTRVWGEEEDTTYIVRSVVQTECVVRCLPQFVHQCPSTEDYEPAVHMWDLESARGVLKMHT